MAVPNLCCRMESCANIVAPEVGIGGACVGVPTFPLAKFNNGILSDVDNEGCTFPTGANNINLDKGTIEFWAKMEYPDDDGANHYFFSFRDSGNGGIDFHWINFGVDEFYVEVYSGGIKIGDIHVASSWSLHDLIHFGIVWDRQGNDIGGGKTFALYINNVEVASSITTWLTDSVNANLYIGINWNGAEHSDAVIDQLKTYDTCKIDFSDRNTEHCDGNNAPTAPTGQQVDGQSSPTGTNCISDLTPGFSAIYNDPDVGDQANAIQIQVGTASSLSDMWDSGWLADATIQGNRCTAKTYAGAALSAGTSYWWRCRFRDDDNEIGTWSAWQQFDICEEEEEGRTGSGTGATGTGSSRFECEPGGSLPKRLAFACPRKNPREEPAYRFPICSS